MKGQPNQLSSMNLPQKPPIVNSVTEDEEDFHETPVDAESYNADSFLRRYETMVRQQENENLATLSHLRPMLELLKKLTNGCGAEVRNDDKSNDTMSLLQEFEYSHLKTALYAIEEETTHGFMKTDAQWILVLKMITENLPNGDHHRISWAEIVQCYKTCILGMQTLENTPAPKEIRNRARERSLSMMNLFRPSNTVTLNNATKTSEAIAAAELSLCKADKAEKDKTEKLSRYFQLVAAFLIGAALMTLSMSIIPHPTPQCSAPGVSKGRRISDYVQTPIVPGPLLSPFPYDMLSPKPLDATAKTAGTVKAVPASISRATLHPSSTPLAPQQIPAQSAFLKQHRHSHKSIKLPNQSLHKSENQTGPFSTDSMTMAGVIGGTAAVGLLGPALIGASSILPTSIASLLPVGVTVIASSLLAHGIRDLIAAIFKRIKRRNAERG
jgi:hypothetical protein